MQIRVSIYKNGQEKAWIEFNSIGANQNNWFDPSRIIASSYTDIKTAAKEVFSMMGCVLHTNITLYTLLTFSQQSIFHMIFATIVILVSQTIKQARSPLT